MLRIYNLLILIYMFYKQLATGPYLKKFFITLEGQRVSKLEGYMKSVPYLSQGQLTSSHVSQVMQRPVCEFWVRITFKHKDNVKTLSKIFNEISIRIFYYPSGCTKISTRRLRWVTKMSTISKIHFSYFPYTCNA